MGYPRYPEYKPSRVEWLGEVPAHWTETRLKNATSVRVSNVDKKAVEGQEAVRLCNYVDVYYHDQITPDLEFMEATATTQQIEKFSLKKGDVLITKDSETPDDIAVPSLVASDLDGVVCGYHLALIRPDTSAVDGAYLARALAAFGVRDQFHSSANGITRFGLSFGDITGASILVPPLDEQRAIAAFLDRETARIDALIARKQRLIELLAEKRTALISQAVTKGLNPDAPMKDSGVKWLGEIPAHWEVKQLRHIGDAVIGLTYEPADVVDQEEGVLVLRASNVSDGRIVLEDNVFVKREIPKRLLTKVGDILICSRSGSRALIGKCAKVGKESAGVSFGTFMTVFRSACNDYLFYVFNSTLFDYQSGAFLTSTINQLTIGNLYSFKMPMPSQVEQAKIVRHLDHETAKLDVLRAKVESVIRGLHEYRAALIADAVTGKIDVRGVAQEREVA